MDLGMSAPEALVPPLTHRDSIAHHHRTHQRVRLDQSASTRCKFQRASHVVFISFRVVFLIADHPSRPIEKRLH
jgi:hypothetical protein